MKVQDLQPGDHFTQEKRGELVEFEVLAVEPIGSRQCRVWFESQLGRDSADYFASAYVPATRFAGNGTIN